MAGETQAIGPTVGQALDGLRMKLGNPAETTLVIVQPLTPDAFFTEEQRDRLAALMSRWRSARDQATNLPPSEQAELDSLVEAEVRAALEHAPPNSFAQSGHESDAIQPLHAAPIIDEQYCLAPGKPFSTCPFELDTRHPFIPLRCSDDESNLVPLDVPARATSTNRTI